MVDTKIAVIGVGGWGKNHARVLKELGCLTVICDLDAARAKEIAGKHGAQAYSSIEEMLDKERLDGCLVCTPTKTHATVAKKVMEADVVFIQRVRRDDASRGKEKGYPDVRLR